jgi:hypothetical protein
MCTGKDSKSVHINACARTYDSDVGSEHMRHPSRQFRPLAIATTSTLARLVRSSIGHPRVSGPRWPFWSNSWRTRRPDHMGVSIVEVFAPGGMVRGPHLSDRDNQRGFSCQGPHPARRFCAGHRRELRTPG